MSDTDLYAGLAAFAAQPRVLVCVDFDGTLAPFVVDPMAARAAPGGIEAVLALAALPGTSVAVVSGRDLATLRRLTGLTDEDAVVLVGSHGGESSLALEPGAALLDEDQRRTLELLTQEVDRLVAAHPGTRAEHKPAAVAVHTRGLPPERSAPALEAAARLAGRHTGVHPLPGKDVLELSVLETSKGVAVRALAAHLRVDATAYLGDDVTDERAFAVLDPGAGDLGIKVGDGESVAQARVASVEAVVDLLERLVGLRTGVAFG